MRYWPPAERHAGFVSGYHLYSVAPGEGERARDVFQPAGAMLRLVFTPDSQWRVRPPDGDWQDVPPNALFGPTAGVTWSDSGVGAVVGVGLRPRGWVRLTTDAARKWANRVGDAGESTCGDFDRIRRQLTEMDHDDQVPGLCDAFLDGILSEVGPADAAIAKVEAAILESGSEAVATIAARCDLTVRTFERLAARAFGFGPKLLLRRARFLRSLHAVAAAEPADRARSIDPAYTDSSHFIRDAHDFLGMSPQAFLKLDNPMLRHSIALRAQVLGAPAQALASTSGA